VAGELKAQLVGSVSDAFLRQDVMPAPLLVRREAFDRLDGFTNDYRLLGHEAEFVARAQLARLECDTVLQDLGLANGPMTDWLAARGYDLPASRFRAARPLLAASPLAMRDLMLLAKGLQSRAGGGALAPKSKAPKLDAIIEEPFTRMMHAILTENSRSSGVAPERPSRVLEE
jgi:hypothetical protein